MVQNEVTGEMVRPLCYVRDSPVNTRRVQFCFEHAHLQKTWLAIF